MTREQKRARAQASIARWEQLLADELTRLFDRQEAVVLARLQGTKARKHTRHWEPPGERKVDPQYVMDPSRWTLDAAGSVEPIVRRLYTETYDSLAGALAPPPPEPATEPASGAQPPPPPPPPVEQPTGAALAALIMAAVLLGGGDGDSDDFPWLLSVWATVVLLRGRRESSIEAGVRRQLDLTAAQTRDAGLAVQRIVEVGEDAGDPLPTTVERVRAWYAKNRSVMAKRIAASVAASATNESTLLAATDVGEALAQTAESGGPVPAIVKQWLSSHDDKVRPTHRAADGQVVPLGEKFRLGGIASQPIVSWARYPGDPQLPAHELLNCRCTMLFAVGDSPQQRKDDDALEAKADRVRTPAGSRHYGKPIGAPIVAAAAPPFSSGVSAAGAAAPAAVAPRRKSFGKIDGFDVTLAGRDAEVRAMIAKHDPSVDPDTTEVLALRDHKDRVAGYVAWQIADGPQPAGTVVAVSVHPSQRGKGLGDKMVRFAAQADPALKPTMRGAGAPSASRPARPARAQRVIGSDGLPVIDDRTTQGDKPGTSGDFDADSARIGRLQKAYLRDRADTESLFSRGGRWSRERERQQQEIIDHFLGQPGVKADRKALVIGGLPGAGKTTAINSAVGQAALGVDLSEYVTVNADEVKAQMIARGMVPDYPGLTADEAATLYHAESFEVAHALMRQAAKRDLNIAYDTSLKSAGQLGFVTAAGSRTAPPPYRTTLLFVDVGPEVAKKRARERYLAGGRYMPLELIDRMRASSSRHSSGPAQQFDSLKGSVDRWVLMDNTGAAPLVAGQGGRPSPTSRPARSDGPVTPPAPAATAGADARYQREIAALDEDLRDQDPQGYTAQTLPLDRLEQAAADPHGPDGNIVTVKPPSGSEVSLSLPTAQRLIRERGGQVPAVQPPAPAYVPSAPAPQATVAATPNSLLPPAPTGALVYVHPQGKTVYVLPDGSLEVYKPDGKRASTSATAAKLAAGYGGWSLVAAAPSAPAPAPARAAARTSAPAAPRIVAAPASPAALQQAPDAPAPRGSLPVVPMDFGEAPLSDVPRYIADPDFVFQQKVDGIRGVLVLEPGKAPWFASKKGDRLQSTTAAKITTPMLAALPPSTPADLPAMRVEGELLNGKFHVFDMIVVGSEKLPYEDRQRMAEAWAKASGLPQVEALPVARTPAEKQALWDAVLASGAEGVMMKRKDSAYNGGTRVNHTLKAKITATADVVVLAKGLGGKENAQIGLRVGGKIVPIGTVSTLGKGALDVGDVVEVEYLWATADNSLAQPRIVRKRSDKTEADVTDASQLRLVDKTVLAVAQKRLAYLLEQQRMVLEEV